MRPLFCPHLSSHPFSPPLRALSFPPSSPFSSHLLLPALPPYPVPFSLVPLFLPPFSLSSYPPLSLPPHFLEVGPLIPLYPVRGSRGALWASLRGLGRSPSRSRIWCILDLAAEGNNFDDFAENQLTSRHDCYFGPTNSLFKSGILLSLRSVKCDFKRLVSQVMRWKKVFAHVMKLKSNTFFHLITCETNRTFCPFCRRKGVVRPLRSPLALVTGQTHLQR